MKRVLFFSNYADQFLLKRFENNCFYNFQSGGYDGFNLLNFKNISLNDIDSIVVHLSEHKIYDQYLQSINKPDFFEKYLSDLTSTMEFLSKFYASNILVILPNYNTDVLFGLSSIQRSEGFNNFIHKLISFYIDFKIKFKGLELIYMNSLTHSYRNYIHFDFPYELVDLDRLSFYINTKLDTLFGRNLIKCIVCDLDNTIWGGVLGDDGYENLIFSPNGRGKIFYDIQVLLKNLKNNGILLAISSKNYEEVVMDAFNSNRFYLKADDFVLIKANWKRKSENILEIINSLSLSPDAFLFLDDNPVERNEVDSLNLGIKIPDLGSDEAEGIFNILSRKLYFDFRTTAPLLDRTKGYQIELKREELKKKFENEADFLISMNLVGESCLFDKQRVDRIQELFLRSNQFNLTTNRRSINELLNIIESNEFIGIYFNLRDFYGDFGLVSAVIIEIKSVDEFIITDWVMSCRVLNRTFEEFILSEILKILLEDKSTNESINLRGIYKETPKNKIVSDLYSRLGFDLVGEGLFELNISKQNNIKMKHYINHE